MNELEKWIMGLVTTGVGAILAMFFKKFISNQDEMQLAVNQIKLKLTKLETNINDIKKDISEIETVLKDLPKDQRERFEKMSEGQKERTRKIIDKIKQLQKFFSSELKNIKIIVAEHEKGLVKNETKITHLNEKIVTSFRILDKEQKDINDLKNILEHIGAGKNGEK